MKILLFQHAPYVGAFGGSAVGNRAILEALVRRGHTCRAVAPASKGSNPQVPVAAEIHQGVEVRIVAQPTEVRRVAAEQTEEFAPDRIIVSSEDPGQLLLAGALRASQDTSTAVVSVIHSPVNVPFGPASFIPNAERTELLRRTGGVAVLSRYLQDYFRRWADIDSEVFHFPSHGAGPFPALNNFDRGYVTLVNPCRFKGITIFLELARAFPEVEFAAVPTWGTSGDDRAALAELPNVRLLQPTGDLDALFAQIRVLLMPSVWPEAFGLVVVDAMLRGVPVLASDVGGLPEAKLGEDYVLPLRPIESYEPNVLNDLKMPVAIVPPQDLAPWREALATLLNDRERYEGLSRASRRAALEYFQGLDIAPFEEFLQRAA